MTLLGRKFHSPKTTDAHQWKKVEALVELGFYFHSVYRDTPEGGRRVAPYPRTLREVAAFAQEFRAQAVSKQPSCWRSERTGVLAVLE
jgi:hypothetical protein